MFPGHRPTPRSSLISSLPGTLRYLMVARHCGCAHIMRVVVPQTTHRRLHGRTLPLLSVVVSSNGT